MSVATSASSISAAGGGDPDDGCAVPDERECNRGGHLEDRRSIRQLAECVPSEREP